MSGVVYDPATTADELHPLLARLGEEYAVHSAAGGAAGQGRAVRFRKVPSRDFSKGAPRAIDTPGPGDTSGPGEPAQAPPSGGDALGQGDSSKGAVVGSRYAITDRGDALEIDYTSVAAAARAVGTVLADLAASGAPYSEETPFSTFGIMIDCSRNAVPTVEYLQSYFRRIALMGYSMVMLYTEDTYEIPGREYFGYMRGRYTAAELATLDRYAADLGIELIACIQTYGHLEQILRWQIFDAVKDTDQVLLAGEEETYRLIDDMVGQMGSCISSRRIHVGMDEAWDMGRGGYLDRFGYRDRFEIFNEHLARVCEICRNHGLEPVIWSDMYFRIASATHDYYDLEARVPESVVSSIPTEARLVYWDYYHDSPDVYRQMIDLHREMAKEPMVASGVWTWGRLAYDHRITQATAVPCIKACRSAGVSELFFTLWGDDGAYCDFDTSLAGLAFVAEQAWSGDRKNDAEPAERFSVACGESFQAVLDAGDLQGPVDAAALLWDDPLVGVYWNQIAASGAAEWALVADHYDSLVKRLSPHAKASRSIDHACRLAKFLSAKTHLRLDLERWYFKRRSKSIDPLIDGAKKLEDQLDELEESFRGQWMRQNKPFGLETLQIRLAGQRVRYKELVRRLRELSESGVTTIPELDAKPKTPLPGLSSGYRDVAVGTTIL